MRKEIIALMIGMAIAPAMASITGNGFYRVKNYGSSRWANLVDNTASVDIGASTADLHALQLTNNYEEIVSDPGSIIFITNIGGTQYDIAGQGITLGNLINVPMNIAENGTAPDGQELYLIYGTYKGATKYIGDANLLTSQEYGTASINVPNSYKDFNKWEFLPLDASGDNYFGAVPTVATEQGNYTTMFTSFAYRPYSAGVKAYYISRVGYGMVEMVEITGAVPPGSPVVIECAGSNASDNRLEILQSQEVLPSNSLTGVYFDYQGRTYANQVKYNPKTMRVLGKCSDGSLGFITSDIEYIPSNTAYLTVPEGTSPELKCVQTEEYEASLPQAPEDFYFTEDFVLLPQGEYEYEGSGYVPAPQDGKNLKLRFYIPGSRADETYVAPSSLSGGDVVISMGTVVKLPFDYNSPYYWVLENWTGGELNVTLNLQYQSATFNAKAAGVERMASETGLVYNGNWVSCPGANEISVYNLSGQRVAHVSGDSLNLSHLPKGVYLATANGKTLKIVH